MRSKRLLLDFFRAPLIGHLEGRRGTATLFLRPEESVLKDFNQILQENFPELLTKLEIFWKSEYLRITSFPKLKQCTSSHFQAPGPCVYEQVATASPQRCVGVKLGEGVVCYAPPPRLLPSHVGDDCHASFHPFNPLLSTWTHKF